MINIMSLEKTRKILVALDFDHTVIDGNSDIHITHLCPSGEVPDDIKEKFSETGWTHYMGAIFEYLYSHGLYEKDLKQSINEIPLTEGMAELFKFLEHELFEVIIISDSNSMFIDYAIEKNNLGNVIDKVYTNPAEYDHTGKLTIKFYHTQDWCKLSTENLCKGHILEEHVKNAQDNVEFSHILYVGDGSNDLCPSLRLAEKDFVFPRKQYSLWKKLKKLGCLDNEETDLELKAKIVEWSSGIEVLDVCKQLERERFQPKESK
ncbi:pyridoxal phosphate phosphatase PHOSPHO2-like isoform X2 [Ruditapes philippinarum]|uniref:pyridoxal phosphate phosphatase PHOSPHO2-like isoform X2 n=1 Tax=Ruditapes philippinarum TaxID=129788 RepID=UPI00295BB100|nr:pyridoxal phosphate phosphatase PHOSPHO2-like isoform X2 [Ruditapes philippinarum]